jgi:hypothetical protein
MPDADLSDIHSAFYPLEVSLPMSISEEEISSVIEKSHPFKAAGSNSIHFFVLKCLSCPRVSLLQPLFQACLNLSYYPTSFSICSTVSLKMSSKGNCLAPEAWRPMALLNKLEKVWESIIVRYTSSLSEELGLLHALHIGPALAGL